MTITGIISWCFFGLIVGALARLFMPGRQTMSILLTIVLGVVGSFAGGAISSLLFGSSESLVNPAGWIMSIIGALIVLFAYTKLAKA
ncbi:MAG: GlsB/YeaQ/YmgE family stress response membrane protein [Maioricimonas sp. JB045]|uniref:GlsB/YeaQ/YmgE family stress response membrane protein n=1 Tax=Maioricimonas sp. JC845 TaxID=3232138 RepID=UPI0034589D57